MHARTLRNVLLAAILSGAAVSGTTALANSHHLIAKPTQIRPASIGRVYATASWAGSG